MRRRVRTGAVAAGLGLLLGLGLPASAAVETADWPAYEHGGTHSSARFGDPTITASNASHVHVAWQFSPGTRWDASPTVVNGRVYIGARNAVLYALDASSGAIVWQKQLDGGSSTYCASKGIVGTA